MEKIDFIDGKMSRATTKIRHFAGRKIGGKNRAQNLAMEAHPNNLE